MRLFLEENGLNKNNILNLLNLPKTVVCFVTNMWFYRDPEGENKKMNLDSLLFFADIKSESFKKVRKIRNNLKKKTSPN